MHSPKARHAARITAAAVGGVLAAALALPTGASATLYKAYDNGVLAFSTQDGAVHTIYPDGSNDQTVSTLTDPLGVKGVAGEWSADGNRLLLVDQDKNLLDVNPWAQRQVAKVDLPYDISGPSMSPDGSAYAFATPADGVRTYRIADQSIHLVVGATTDTTAWSNSDNLLFGFSDEGAYNVHQPLAYADGNAPANWAEWAHPNPRHVTVSRDGQKIAYTAPGNEGDGEVASDDVYVANADGTSPYPTNIESSTESSDERLPAISPDGKKVAFISNRAGDGTWSIYVRDLTEDETVMVPNTKLAPGASFTGLSWQPAQKPHLAESKIIISPEIGNTLKLDDQFDDPTPPFTTKWQWQRCTDVVNDWTGTCQDMPGEIDAGYRLIAGDVGYSFRVIRTVTNAAGTDTNTSLITEPAEEPDTTPPGVPTITTKPAARSNAAAPTFAWTGAEAGGTFQCSIDNGTFVACTTGSTFPVSGDGPHSFRVRQTDWSNNVGDPAEYAWTLDTSAPNAPIVTSKPDAVTASQNATVAFVGDEPGGRFECRLGADGATWIACASPVTLVGLSEGAKRFSIRQVDDAGNAGVEKVLTWKVDLTAPLAPSITEDKDVVHAFTTQYAFTGEEDATFECRLDDADWATCTSPVTLSDYASGPHTFRVRQTDAAGHVSPEAEDVFTAFLDGPAQPVLGDGAPAPRTNDTTATFAFGGEAARYECRLDDGTWTTCSSPATFESLADGEHTFRVRGVDDYDIPGAATTRTWTVDTSRPALPTFANAPAAQTTSHAIDVQVGGLEDGATVECDVDGQGWTECASPLKLDGFGLGRHTLKVRQTDAAGNVSDVAAFAWTVVAETVPTTPTPDTTTTTPATPSTPGTPDAAPTPAPRTQDGTPATTNTNTNNGAAGGKPKLSAVLGTGSGTRSTATITVRKDGVGVGCSITGTVLTSCKVDLYALDTTAHGTAAAAAAKRVLVGTGTYHQADGSKRMRVDVALNATGRALMRKSPHGLKVSVKITGTPVKGEKLQAAGVATLVRRHERVTVGGFAVNSAKLTPAAQRQLGRLAERVKGNAVAIRVVGHTDASSDDARYLDDLGLRRAKAVAAYLHAHGVKAQATLVTRGSRQPKATNATESGRAQNRRVELRIDR
ncbi:MAG TPA: OmpA family protein [Baekduia sp.]|uniref:OmpA family protein n=1 Tax=Baekduia sp. TaxID=2600305 RepID=UPI002D77865C|nr:OmpA family protein [Baekduia sp.]HET6505248.1 OmpA family protein [Baekduia sp.]